MEGRPVNEDDSRENEDLTLGEAVFGRDDDETPPTEHTDIPEASPTPEEPAETETTAGTEATAAIPPVVPPVEASSAASDDIPPSDEGSDPTKKKRRRWPWITAAAVVVVAAAYVGGAFYYADRVPKATEVAGIKMGGLDRDAAAAKLKADVVDQLSQPVELAVEGADDLDPITISPSDYSLAVDENATVDSVVGFSLSPARMWAHLAGGSNVDPVYSYDEDQLATTVDSIAEQTDREPENASIAFDGTEPVLTEAKAGLALDKDATSTVLSEELLTQPSPITLAAEEAEPDITTDAANEVLSDVAEPLVASNITVSVKDQTTDLTPEQLAEAASFKESDGKLALNIDGEELADAVTEALPDTLTPGKDATIKIVDHSTPKITESEDGLGIGADELAEAVVGLKKDDTDRTVTLEPTGVPADFTTEDAKELGIKEVISEIKTPLTDDSVRTKNLLVGTKKITNTLVKPDETFSLEEALGPITAENGFVSSGVVANGFNSTAMGGGLSQLSTNTFNIGYLGGMEDVEHKPHSKYFDRYPMGREATLWEGTIDMKWKNTSPYGVVIDTWVADGYVHSQLWSTKYWDVKASTSDPYNYRQPTTKNNPAADCVPSGAGGPGFTVDVSRTVSHDGTTNEELSGGYSWTYSPVDAVTCN